MEAITENEACGHERPRILIVEDEFLIRFHIGEELRAAGFTVVEAMSAEEAMSLLSADPNFHAVVTDIRMGGKTDGLALANWIRGNVPGIKVAIASGNLELVDQEYDAVFSKPHDIPLIVSTLRQLLASEVPAGAQSAIKFTLDANDLIVDIQPRTGDWLTSVAVEDIIGTPLLSHVTGVATAAFIRGILDGARRGKCTKIPYRCDTPDRRRSWTMEFKLEEQGRLSIVHRLVEDAPFLSSIVFRSATVDFVDAIPRCSVCNRIFTNGAWREADDALPDRSGRESLKVIYEICSACNFLACGALNI
jgi:CheY-like chemotaxis protein